MKVFVDPRKYLPLALVLGAFAIASATPAVAVAKERHATAHTSRLGYAYAPAGVAKSSSLVVHQSASRSAAIRACSKEAEKYHMISWQSTQITVYGECMTDHGQPLG